MDFQYSFIPKVYFNKLLGSYNDVEIYEISLFAPIIAKHYLPGQFVILMVNEFSERIPLTITKTNPSEGSINLIYQVVGFTTKLLSKLKQNDVIYHIVGPLGRPAEIKYYGKVIFVSGGVGAAEVYPVAKAFKECGNYVAIILGARTKSLLILEEDFRKISDILYVTTDDGSYGEKGFVTDVLTKILNEEEHIDLVYTVGPLVMMKNVSEITKKHNIKTIVSLNTIMVDGTGMCGSCRISCSGQTKYVCCDGPEFDGHSIDWQEIIARNNTYLLQEKEILKKL